MPYPRRRIMRRSVRGYGRRRRFSRRRPSTARSVPRTSFAPRHQYLKLRAAFSYANTAGLSSLQPITFNLDRPYQPLTAAPNWVRSGSIEPLGWNAYGSLFQRYVVHGSKWVAKFHYRATSTTSPLVFQYPLNWAVSTEATTALTGDDTRSAPISGMLMLKNDNTATFSRYFNNNRIMGQSVTKHDRYYRAWGDVSTAADAYIKFEPQGTSTEDLYAFFTVTWYISAVSSNSRLADPAAMAQLAAFTTPWTKGPEDPDPAAFEHQRALDTGVTMNKRALSSAGLGGDDE